jgi:exosortase/archaeosortase family protein
MIKTLLTPECSGVHSTLALFLTSLVAGRLFLHTAASRALLSASAVPLSFVRNGLRIFTIGQLCVHIGPQMIACDIHRHGRPFFFPFSLIPLFALLILLRTR